MFAFVSRTKQRKKKNEEELIPKHSISIVFLFLASTAMHAVENNYRTVLIEDACRGVNEKEIEVKRALLNENGCIFVDSHVVMSNQLNRTRWYALFLSFNQVPGMISGQDRRPEVARHMFVENLKAIGRYNAN